MSKGVPFDTFLVPIEYHNLIVFARPIFVTMHNKKNIIIMNKSSFALCQKVHFLVMRKGDRNGTFQKKAGFKGPEVWPADGVRPGRKCRRPDGMAVSVRLWGKNCGEDLPSAGRTYKELRLSKRSQRVQIRFRPDLYRRNLCGNAEGQDGETE